MPLSIATRFGQNNELLSPGEISDLRAEFKAYAAAVFAAYPKREYLTIKAHMAERNVPCWQVRHHRDAW